MKLTELNLASYITSKVDHILEGKRGLMSRQMANTILADARELGVNGMQIIHQIDDLVEHSRYIERNASVETRIQELIKRKDMTTQSN